MGHLLVFIGPPGSGKGSLSQFCIEKFGWKQLSTGSLCRKHILEKSEIGKRIDFAIKSGKLIADNLMICLVENWLSNNKIDSQTVVLDGFPRTKKQAEHLVEVVQEKLQNCKLKVVQLYVDDVIIIKRLTGRMVCNNKDCQAVYSVLAGSSLAPKNSMECDKCSGALVRRPDDRMSAIQKRLQIYHEQAQPMIDFFTHTGIEVCTLDMDRLPALIFNEFEQIVKRGMYDHN